MMQPFHKHTGVVAPLDKVNVDTDQIIPKQFLKRIERTGFGEFLFYDWRVAGDGKEPGHSLDEADDDDLGELRVPAARRAGTRSGGTWALGLPRRRASRR